MSQWIPVSDDERRPEDGVYVLVNFANFAMADIAIYEDGTFYPRGDAKSYESYGLIVNAWMPMPEPYREREEE